MSERPSRYSFFEIGSMLLFLLLAAFFYRGFFYPDEFFVRRASGIYKLALHGFQIGFPIVVAGLLLVYHLVKAGKIAAMNIGLMTGSLILIGFLLFPLGNWLYNRSLSYEKSVGSYHPYLQLSAKKFTPKRSRVAAPFRIVCLGGSTTEWKDDEKRGWPNRVEELLNERLGRQDIEVYNLGRQWYTTQHSLINYMINIREHKPDMLIVMHVINDLVHNADFSYFSHEAFQSDYRHFFGPVNGMITRQGLEANIFEKFNLYWYNQPREVLDDDDFPGVHAFERNLNTLIDIAKMDSIPIVLMTQPHLLKASMSEEELEALYMVNNEAIGPDKQWSHLAALKGFDLYNRTIRELAARRGVCLVDLETAVPKSLEYLNDDVHYAEQTYDVIGEFIASELIRQGALQASAAVNR